MPDKAAINWPMEVMYGTVALFAILSVLAIITFGIALATLLQRGELWMALGCIVAALIVLSMIGAVTAAYGNTIARQLGA